ncbi:MAG: undecaprenyl-phosphate galactose phosphotransferase WbaP [Betaproteobacteria bacterium]|nr:undecaprenyl-phosphate galactose phosphotransferase WbaP [Betaproteobacteria bacterium]MDH5350184.1 undecaprenyl-phosphate galactose phosphotransferase WbaP [Betaproteobacteria bacterium]
MRSVGDARSAGKHDPHDMARAGRAATRERRSAVLRRVSGWLAISDAASLVFSWLLALGLLRLLAPEDWWQGIVAWWVDSGESRAAQFFLLLALVLVLFAARGHYSKRRPAADEVLDTLKVFLLVVVVDSVLAYLTKTQFSRAWFISAWSLAVVILPLARTITKKRLMRLGRWQRPTVILGAGPNAREAARALRSEPLMGLDVVAFLAPNGEAPPAAATEVDGQRIEVLPAGDDLEATLERMDSPHLMVALEAENLMPYQKLLQRLSARYVDLSIVPPLRGLPLYGMEMTHFFTHEVLMLTARNNLARPLPRFLKRLFDIVGAFAFLFVLAPLFAYLVWRIWQTGGAPVFSHTRVGRYGRPFGCLKFRTMVPNADEVLKALLETDPAARAEWERDFKLKDDPRITGIGEFLRRTSLDELPQLWNVLKGEMSLVGPRPIIEDELERYGDQVGYYLETRPGITGLWQISGRNDTGYEDRVALDSWYVRNWSLWYDVVILVKTVRVVLRREGAY